MLYAHNYKRHIEITTNHQLQENINAINELFKANGSKGLFIINTSAVLSYYRTHFKKVLYIIDNNHLWNRLYSLKDLVSSSCVWFFGWASMIMCVIKLVPKIIYISIYKLSLQQVLPHTVTTQLWMFSNMITVIWLTKWRFAQWGLSEIICPIFFHVNHNIEYS